MDGDDDDAKRARSRLDMHLRPLHSVPFRMAYPTYCVRSKSASAGASEIAMTPAKIGLPRDDDAHRGVGCCCGGGDEHNATVVLRSGFTQSVAESSPVIIKVLSN